MKKEYGPLWIVLILAILLILALSSCSVFKKHRSSTVEKSDSTHVQKVDSLVIVKKDSTHVKQESSQNENSIEIEFDTAAASETDTLKASDYFSFPVRQKIKKVTIHHSQIVNKKDSARKIDESLSNHSRIDSTGVKKESRKETVSKESTGLLLWLLSQWWVWLLLALAILWLYHAYKRYTSPL